jgi:glucokinase
MNPATTFQSAYILGFDIGGTKTALVAGTLEGKIMQRTEFLTPVSDSFNIAISKIEKKARDFIEQCQNAGFGMPKAVSVAVGGPLDIEQGILFTPPHLKNWDRAPLKQHLTDTLRLPVFVEHDGNSGALAEFYFGAGKGTQNLVFLTMGTGLGAGIILNGSIFHGSSDAAGEVGHVRMAEDGPEEYGKAGSWEGFCSGAGILKLARLRYPDIWGPEATTRDVVQQALEGDAPAVKLIEEVGSWLGKGLAALVDILNPDVIIIGTLGVVLGDLVLEPARKVVEREALEITARACRIVPAQLGTSLMDTGCLMAVYDAYRHGRLSL